MTKLYLNVPNNNLKSNSTRNIILGKFLHIELMYQKPKNRTNTKNHKPLLVGPIVFFIFAVYYLLTIGRYIGLLNVYTPTIKTPV